MYSIHCILHKLARSCKTFVQNNLFPLVACCLEDSPSISVLLSSLRVTSPWIPRLQFLLGHKTSNLNPPSPKIQEEREILTRIERVPRRMKKYTFPRHCLVDNELSPNAKGLHMLHAPAHIYVKKSLKVIQTSHNVLKICKLFMNIHSFAISFVS